MLINICTQIAAQTVLSDEPLKKKWEEVISSSTASTHPEMVHSTQRAVVLKMLHTQFKEFATNTRTLEILDEGKSADVDVALRAKLKTHAAEKHLH